MADHHRVQPASPALGWGNWGYPAAAGLPVHHNTPAPTPAVALDSPAAAVAVDTAVVAAVVNTAVVLAAAVVGTVLEADILAAAGRFAGAVAGSPAGDTLPGGS